MLPLAKKEILRAYCPELVKERMSAIKTDLAYSIRHAKEQADKTGNSPLLAFVPGEEAFRAYHNHKKSSFERQVDFMQKMLPPDMPFIVGMSALVRDGLKPIILSCLFTRNEQVFLPTRRHPASDADIVREFYEEVYLPFMKGKHFKLPLALFDFRKSISGRLLEWSGKKSPMIEVKGPSNGQSQQFELRICSDIRAKPANTDKDAILLLPASNIVASRVADYSENYKAIIINDSMNGVNYFLNPSLPLSESREFFYGISAVSIFEEAAKGDLKKSG
jgi:hypothetical protein